MLTSCTRSYLWCLRRPSRRRWTNWGSAPSRTIASWKKPLVSIVQAVPALRTRLLGQVHLTLDQVATVLRITPSTLKQLVQTEVIPVSSSGNAAPQRQVIVATELLKRRSRHPTASGRVV